MRGPFSQSGEHQRARIAAREEEARGEHDEEHRVPRDEKALRADLASRCSARPRARRRRSAFPIATRRRRSRRLEREDQLRRAGIGIERRAHAEERARDADGRDRDRRRRRVDVARIDADEFGGIRVVQPSRESPARAAYSLGRAAGRRATRPRRRTSAARVDRSSIVGHDVPTVEREIADIERAMRIGTELLKERVVDYDREPERAEQRRERARAQAALENRTLQEPAERAP